MRIKRIVKRKIESQKDIKSSSKEGLGLVEEQIGCRVRRKKENKVRKKIRVSKKESRQKEEEEKGYN